MLIAVLMLVCSSYTLTQTDWNYVPFDDAMQKKDYPQAIITTQRIMGVDGEVLYDFFKKIYENLNFSMIQPQTELKIPKIIHQIWLGSKLPEEFIALQQSWIEHHIGRDWMYKLWTDEDVANLQLYNQAFYDATDNFGVKSDILRWELLYNFGGVYIDMDFECLRALDQFHYTYDFYTALQPLDTLFVQLGAALVGAVPGHPILKHCIETIKEDWHLQGAPKKTGPVHFTKSFCTCANMNGNKDIAFPAFYFYPLGCRGAEFNKNIWINQGSYAVHWWAKSWMPKTYRPSLFKNIHNDASVENWNS
ncbi:MAG TPA: glycosyltransferase [Candidatus Babeliales bacterium]|nr:glycosyltransferase [Candidatus Babeliales bacterium]